MVLMLQMVVIAYLVLSHQLEVVEAQIMTNLLLVMVAQVAALCILLQYQVVAERQDKVITVQLGQVKHQAAAVVLGRLA